MTRIVFYPLAQFSHVNGTFKLARQLRARGHGIHYMSLVDVEDHVRAQGWDFTPMFEHLFPKGFRDATDAILNSDLSRAEKQLAGTNLVWRMQAQFSEILLGPVFEARLQELQPDLLLVDATFPLPALTALRLGIPAAVLSITLPLREDDAIPPLGSDAPPPTGLWPRFKIRANWRFITSGGLTGYGKYMRNQLRYLSMLYPGLGKLWDFRSHLQYGPHVNIPTLITCCSEFDFPRASLENLHYIGPQVDLERTDPPLPPEVEQDSRPLLYCSLGSLGYRAVPHRPFFQAVLDAVARKPDWRLLMVVGKSLDPASFRVPSNATVVQFAPQLAVLRKASLMITHGGLNTVKECICLGVPMVVFPTGFDQPGNGARIVHHGLGLMGNIRTATTETISALIDKVAGDSSYRTRVRAMQEVFLTADAAHRGVELVERLAANRPAKLTPTYRLNVGV